MIRSLALTLLLAPAALAAPPQTLTHTMRLTDALGAPLQGEHDVTVRLMAGEDATAPSWSDTFEDVVFANGYAAVVLGSDVALPTSTLLIDDLWVSVVVDTNSELSRVPLTSVPYARVASDVALSDGRTIPRIDRGRSAIGNRYCHDVQSGGGNNLPSLTFEASAGESFTFSYQIDGRPNANGHLYSTVYLDGQVIGSGSEFSGGDTWRRSIQGTEVGTVSSSGTHTVYVKLSCGNGTTYFRDTGGEWPNGGFSWTVTVGG